jgi:hypothetical protein
MNIRALPPVRYRGETRKNCEIAHHPNNSDDQGGWRDVSEGGAQIDWKMVLPLDQLQQGKFCVGLNEHESGVNTPYVFVGKVVTVDREKATFSMEHYNCTNNPWEKICLTSKWRKKNGEKNGVGVEHACIIMYFDALTKAECLPSARKLQEHGIPWQAVPKQIAEQKKTEVRKRGRNVDPAIKTAPTLRKKPTTRSRTKDEPEATGRQRTTLTSRKACRARESTEDSTSEEDASSYSE